MHSQYNTPCTYLMLKTISLKLLIRNLSLLSLFVLSLTVTNANAQLKPSFDSAKGPTLLAGSNPSLSKGSTYIYQNVASSTDGIVDAIVTITDLHYSSVKGGTIDQIISNNARFEPITSTSKSGGYVEWQVKFVLDGTVTHVNDKGIPAYVDSITLEAIDVDGYEFFEAIVTNSYTLEGGSSPRTELSVSNKSGYTRFQSGHSSSNDIDPSKTQYIVRINYKNVNTLTFRNGRSYDDDDYDGSNRQNSISFLGEVTFDRNRTTVLNVAPVVQDKISNTTQVNTRFDIDLLDSATDADGNLERSSVILIDPSDITNQGSDGNPLVIPSIGTYTVDKYGALRFTPVNNYQGPANIWFSVSDKLGVSSDRATLGLDVAAVPDATNSTISSAASAIIADGVSTTTITVQAIDSNGINLTSGGDAVVLTTTAGTLSPVTDNGNGTYSATLTAPTAIGTATITGSVNTAAITDNAIVEFTSGTASPINSTISSAAPAIVANGTSTTIITVEAIDANGNNLTTGGDAVVLTTTAGTLSAVTDNGNGTYSATLTSSTTSGTATVTGTLNTVSMTDNARVNFTSGTASPINSTISAADPAIEADGVSTTTITVQAIDANGNNLTSGGDTVVLSTTAGTLSAVTDNGNGTYSATLTSSTTSGTATVTGTLNTVSMTDNARVNFTSGTASPINSTISAADPAIEADGVSTTTITVQAIDANGNNLTSGGDTVVLSTTAGTLSAVTDNGNGTYSAVLTSPTTAGTTTITGTLNTVPMTDNASVDFTKGTASAINSTISAADPAIVADGISRTNITVQAIDSEGSNLVNGGDTVVLSTSSGTLSAVTDNGDGTYSAILTSSLTETTAIITGTLNSVAMSDSATVIFTPNIADATSSLLTASLDTIVADGFTQSLITLQAVNVNGINLNVGGDTVVIESSAGSISATSDNGDGTYSATLTSATVPSEATVSATLNTAPTVTVVTIDFVERPTVVTQVTQSKTPTLTGTVTTFAGATFTVSVDSKSYTLGDGNLSIDGNNWTLVIPGTNAINVGTYPVTASIVDSASQQTDDISTNELTVEAQLPSISLTIGAGPDGINTPSYPITGTCVAIGNSITVKVTDTNADSVEMSGIPCNDNGTGQGQFATTVNLSDLADGNLAILATISNLSGISNSQLRNVTKNVCSPNNTTSLCDSDADGIPDGIELQAGTNPTNNDSDNDGIPDAIEFGIDQLNPVDTDGDGVIDALDNDSDNDGKTDKEESGSTNGSPIDSDGDGIPNYRDTDSDNDGIPDAIENQNTNPDADGDMIPDYLDADSDNDGIPDALENGLTLGTDSDSDGIDDAFDVDVTGGTDANNDGVDDSIKLRDTDGDGIADISDIDSDNDGIPDSVEADLTISLDTDLDGIKDIFDVDSTGGSDTNNDGIDDIAATLITDTDGDGLPDYRDLDSDNDGLSDVVEAGGTDIAPEDALIDNFEVTQGTLLTPLDTDSDNIPDYRDLESTNPANDGTGPFDIATRDDAALLDADNNGIVDNAPDNDQDGILDTADENPYIFGTRVIPTVNSLVTNDTTPTLTGTLNNATGLSLLVTVNDVTYTQGDGNLSINGDIWSLNIPESNALADGTYSVIASLADTLGNLATDETDNELVIDTIAPTITLPTIPNANGTNTPAFIISGSCTAVGDLVGLSITDVDSRSVSDSTLACIDDGTGKGVFTKTLDLSPLQDGPLDIRIVSIDLAGNEAGTNLKINKNACTPDNTSSLCDVDRDGVPDGLEIANGTSPATNDSDQDGIPDGEEFGPDPFNPVDTDGDGIIDALDADSDNDGIPDIQENGTNPNGVPLDSDDDGIPNYQDTDSDNDGIPDAVENANANPDADSDMIPDYLDSDSDNDGIPDALESGLLLGTDSDADGIDDGIDVDITGGIDANNDGIDDNLQLRDTDGDGIPDTSDIDSDNDGIPDSVEADLMLIPDSDLDGIKDIFDVDITGGVDANNDGVDDNAAALITDTDGDGLPDYRDLDSDNDGLSDVVEAGGTDIAPEDGLIDNFEVTQGTLLTPIDTDGDNIPDYRDLESTNPANDGTGPFDIASRDDAAAVDADNNGIVDDSADNDQDGISDPVDPNDFIFGSLSDLDLDGIPDSIDLDDDNDGIPDIQEGSGLVDTDGDGVPDSMDLDSDNDGIHDVLEADNGRVDVDQNGRIDQQIDLNNDGLDDNISINMIPVDTDNDSVPDFRDLDSDGDGIFDFIESLDPSLNPSLIDANNDGRVDKVGINGQPETINKAIDFDGDGKPDFRDLDSDNDGFDDKYEIGDFDGDGRSDRVENSGGIKTAVRGAGAFGIESGLLILLTIGTLIRRIRPINKRLHLLLVVMLPLMFSSQLKADDAELCGYKLADSDQRILKGDDDNIDSEFSSCFYVGLGLGLSHIKPEGESNGWSTNDSKDWGWKALIGQHFTPHWFWELSYTDLGEAGLSNRNPSLTALIPDANINYHVPALMAGYWFRDEYQPINVYLKAGLSLIRNQANDSRIGFEEQTSVQLALGAGVQYRFDDSAWFTRLELDSYDKDARILTLQIGRYFGGPDKREPVVEPIPAAPIVAILDGDKDGVTDANDQCPQTYPGATVDSNGCELDHDKDRVVDRLDQCPETPAGQKVDVVGCSIDNDGDGVINEVDKCPRTPVGQVVLGNGCPEMKLGVLHGVNFKTNSAELTSEAVSILNDVVSELTRVPDVHVQIQAHTDNRGSSAYNQQLSEKRAKSVLDYLVSKGIDSQRLVSIGLGESRPIADNATMEGRQKNRRVEIHAINQ